MASTTVEIVNNALIALGQATITSLADPTPVAVMANHRWATVRDAVLRDHPWNCVMAQEELAVTATTPTHTWDYLYTLPSDCLRVVRVLNSAQYELNESGDFEIQGRYILSDEETPLYIDYIKQETDPTKYDALLCEALTAAMAASMAYALSAKLDLRDYWQTQYEAVVSRARAIDAQENPPGAFAPSAWARAKRGFADDD